MEKKITDETILSIIEDYTDTDIPVKEIAAKYNIAASSVYYVLKQMDIPLRDSKKAVPKKKKNKTKEETKKVEVVESTPLKPKSKFSNIGCGTSLICGLVAERHDMPSNVGLYIFEKQLSGSLMFNFDEQYEIAKKFIIEHVFENNDKPIKDLIVYCTGIQSALASVIRAAYDLRVNLILAHYDAYNKKYKHQLMWGGFTEESPINDKLVKLINTGTMYQYYNCKYQDINDTLFVVTYNGSNGIKKIFVCASMADAYDLYLSTIKKLSGSSTEFGLYADEYTIEGSKLIRSTMIKSNNYQS